MIWPLKVALGRADRSNSRHISYIYKYTHGTFIVLLRYIIIYINMFICIHTVDGRNLAPADMVNIPLFMGFYTSQVVITGFLPSTVGGGVDPNDTIFNGCFRFP